MRGQEIADQARIARRHPHSFELRQLGEATGSGGEPERGLAEVEAGDLDRGRTGIEQQVTACDSHIERARPHVGGDIARAQVEELDVIARIGDSQGAGIAAAGISGLEQHLGRRLAQRPFVGYCNSQHFRCSSEDDMAREAF